MAPEDTTQPPPPLRIGLPSRLGEMLIRRGLVTADEVEAALAEQAAGSEWRLGRLLVRRGALDDRTLVDAIAHQFHVPMVDLRVDPPTAEALERLSPTAALQLRALPLRFDADALVVAVADPPTRELRVAVERSAGLPVRLVLAAADELSAALEHWYSEDHDVTDPAGAGPPESLDPTAPVPEFEAANDLQIVVWLLTEAVHRDASAVHLDHGPDELRIRYRVDRDVVPGPVLPGGSGAVVCHRLVAAAQLDPDHVGLHEGTFDTVVDGRAITCRVTALTAASGTHVVVRIAAAARPTRIEDLAIGPADAAAVRAILHEGRGVVVVASALPATGADVCRVLVDEAGPERRVVVGVMRDGAAPSGALVLTPGDDGDAGRAVATARALGADVLVVDVEDAEIRRGAFDAAGELLVVLRVQGEDPSDVAATLVEDVGAFLVAGMLRAVVVAGTGSARPAADVHLVTEEVCRAILDPG